MSKFHSIKLTEDNIEKEIINFDMASETDNVSATDSCSVTVPIKGVGGKGGRAGAHNPMMMMMNGDAESTGTTDDHFIELSINATSGLKVPKPIKTDGFDSYWEFLLAALSYAVGLGNIWRFPYLVYRNGGGAFLIPWLVMLFLIGIPLFVLEFSFGQYMQTSPVNVWKVAPLFCGIGYAMAAMSALVAVYYNMIIAWAMRYFITSIFQNIYWDSCVNAWNTDACMKHPVKECRAMGGTMLFNGTCAVRTCLWENVTNIVNMNLNPVSLPMENGSIVCDINDTLWANFTMQNSRRPSEEYFHYEVLGMTQSIGELGGLRLDLVACYAISWAIVVLCLIQGLKSMGKFSYFTAIFPYAVLICLFFRCLNLDGAFEGIKFYLTPDFGHLLKVSVWSDAAMQIFFSLSPCWGGIITLARGNSLHHNFVKDAWIISIGNCLTSFFAGFVTFSIIGFMAKELGKDVGEVVGSGAGLAFVTYTDAVSRMPWSKLWAAIFFFMLLTLGFGTQFTLVESVVSTLHERFYPKGNRWQKRRVLIGTCSAMFVFGLLLCTDAGMYYLQLMDNYCASFSAIIIGVVELVVLMHVYGSKRFVTQCQRMLGKVKFHSTLWCICWLYITPGILSLLLLMTALQYEPPTYGDYVYPAWAAHLGWVFSFASPSLIPLVAIYKILALPHGTLYERICFLCRPSPSWIPPRLGGEDEERDDELESNEDQDEDSDERRRHRRHHHHRHHHQGGGGSGAGAGAGRNRLSNLLHLPGGTTGVPHHSESTVALKNGADSDENVSDSNSNIYELMNSPEEFGFTFSNAAGSATGGVGGGRSQRLGMTPNSSSNSLDSDLGISMKILKK